MISGIILDLDGTVYLGNEAIPGAAGFVARAREEGMRPLFVTNRANRTGETICSQLNNLGIACDLPDILTSAQATAGYLKEGKVYYVGEDGLGQALEDHGLVISEDSPDYVVVGFDRSFDYAKLKKACRLIDRGAKFIATNPDKGLRTENGISPGTGAIVAAVAAGCGVDPVIIGKPEPLIVEMALERLGMKAEEVIMVGDNVTTDIPAGQRAGLRTALILTGISTRQDAENSAAKPTWTVNNYEALSDIVFKTS